MKQKMRGWMGRGLLLASALTGAAGVHAQAHVDARVDSRMELVCQIRVGSETRWLHQSPSPDPYVAQSVDLGERMRFRAVVQGQPDHIESITLTVYELDLGDAPVILQQSRLSAPFHLHPDVPALTGWSHVYAQSLGRELRYGCALQPVPSQASAASGVAR